MQVSEFLDSIVPSGWLYVAQLEKGHDGKTWFKHVPCKNALVAEEYINNNLTRELYYAMSSFKEDVLEVKGKKRPVRKHTNVKAIQSFFFDIDCNKGEGTYPDKATAAKALIEFTQETKLPLPTYVVDSGGGLHVYWLVERPLTESEWKPLAETLKKVALDKGLLIDKAVTADVARVLRPINTTNHKHGVQVMLKLENKRTTVDTLRAALQPYMMEGLQGGVFQGQTSEGEDELATEYKNNKKYFTKNIIRECPVFKEVYETNGADCSEPFWKNILHTVAFTDDASDFIHELSKGHPTYTPQGTEDKFAERLEAKEEGIKPITCAVYSEYSDKCKTCIYAQFIKSPIALGDDAGNILYPPGWKISDGYIMKLTASEDDPSGEWRRITNYKFSDFTLEEGEQFEPILAFNVRNKKSSRHCRLPADKLASPIKFEEWAHMNGIHLKDTTERGSAKSFMTSFMEKLGGARPAVRNIDRFGWTERGNGFALPGVVYWPDGSTTDNVKDIPGISDLYEPKGTLEEWQKVADFITTQGIAPLNVVLASAFAGPVVEWTGLPGLFLSIVSPESGLGKTSVLKTATSVWGDPLAAMNSLNDTANSVVHKLAQTANIPAYWDEIRMKKDTQSFVRTVFQLVQGKEKTRMNSRIELRDAHGWKTLLVGASNNSFMDAMSEINADTPGYYRTYEMRLRPYSQGTNLGGTTDLFALTHKNYGQAGHVYIKYLVTKQKHAQDTYKHIRDIVDKALQPKPDERFWLATAAVIGTGAQLANECGVTKFDVAAIMQYLIDNVRMLREDVKDELADSGIDDVVAKFIADIQPFTVRTDTFTTKNRAATLSKDPARASAVAQYAETGHQYRFPLTTFRTFLRKHNKQEKMSLELLRTAPYYVAEGLEVIGLGTSWGNARPQEYCVTISLPGSTQVAAGLDQLEEST